MSSRPQILVDFPRPGRACLTLGGILLVVMSLQLIALLGFGVDPARTLGLHSSAVFSGAFWQPLTSLFVHSTQGFGHLIFNLLALWIFGAHVESRLGSRRIWQLFFAGGLAGALLVLLLDAGRLALGYSVRPVVGASGGIAAIVAMFCVLHWNVWLNLFVARFTGRHLLILFVAIDLLRAVAGAPISVASHMGGLAAGLWLASPRWRPSMLYLKAKLWWMQRRLRVHKGGRDDNPLH